MRLFLGSDFSMPSALDAWEKSHYLSLTLWDIDLQFQKANEAYEEWLATRKRRRPSKWECFAIGAKSDEDELQRALCLGRRVKDLMEKGIEAFGARFEKGDSKCNAIVSAQLLRAQHEIHAALLNHSLSRTPAGLMPFDDILTASLSVRRTCLNALRDQYARLQSPSPASSILLPPPRFRVEFCPFALQLQKITSKIFTTKQLRPHDRHDEREICPYCTAEIPVSIHSGLPQYRHYLFKSHLAPTSSNSPDCTATFACTGCYKTFDDSYGFLDHVFQKETGSERSCQMKSSGRDSVTLSLNSSFTDSDPALVERCLRSCLRRELARSRAMQKAKQLDSFSSSPNVSVVKRDSVMSKESRINDITGSSHSLAPIRSRAV